MHQSVYLFFVPIIPDDIQHDHSFRADSSISREIQALSLSAGTKLHHRDTASFSSEQSRQCNAGSSY